ncbi:MAG: DNA replication/repair protein RecF [Bauldia sp.]
MASPTNSTAAVLSRKPEPVAVTGLKLTAFRNYGSAAIRFEPIPVVLTGDNGAGKTNLLEAVSFLSPGRGLRRARLGDVGRRPGDGTWAVAATLVGPGGETEIGTGLALSPEGPERQRSVRINRVPATSSQALLDYVRVVWLAPAMDGLFTGPASDRRRFLDRLVLAIDPLHGDRVNAYERAMRSRNRLLEEGRNEPKWLDAIELQLAELGVAVAAARRECVSLLRDAIDEGHASGAFPAAVLGMIGTIEEKLGTGTATEVEDLVRRSLAAARPADRAAGRTLAGPHLSDLAVVHGPKNAAAADCSTGEQKALLIGLVLAHARLVARMTGETPVILLDEVAAHLDETRRNALFDLLLDLGAQAFMTGTEPGPFAGLGDAAQRFRVADGEVFSAAP